MYDGPMPTEPMPTPLDRLPCPMPEGFPLLLGVTSLRWDEEGPLSGTVTASVAPGTSPDAVAVLAMERGTEAMLVRIGAEDSPDARFDGEGQYASLNEWDQATLEASLSAIVQLSGGAEGDEGEWFGTLVI